MKIKALIIALLAISILSCSKDDDCECKQYLFEDGLGGYDAYADCRIEQWMDENLLNEDGEYTIDTPEEGEAFFDNVTLYSCEP